jgi:RNA recognition motif-containing protein
MLRSIKANVKSVRANVRKRKYVEHKEPKVQTRSLRSNSIVNEEQESMSVEGSQNETKTDPDAKRRLFLGNLSPLTTEAQTVEFLSAVGMTLFVPSSGAHF